LPVAFCRLADSSRHWHPWAQDLYAQARQRGHDHPPRDPDRRARVVPRALAMLAATTPPTTPRDTTRCNATVTIPSPSGGQTDTEATRRLTRPGLWRPDLTEVATRT